MTVTDEFFMPPPSPEARGWLLELGGYCTFWQSEEMARSEYRNLLLLGHGKDTALTPLFAHPAPAGGDAGES